jgi:hypothetical protein
MPWIPVSDLQNLLVRMGLLRTSRNCPDCNAEAGQPHKDGCDVERCSSCGGQRLSCDCGGTHDKAFARWTGFWPGELECLGLGLVARWQPDPACPVTADELCTNPGVDLNLFHAQGFYRAFWIKPGPQDETASPIHLLSTALTMIDDLLSTVELNMDDLESTTLEIIAQAATFQNQAAQAGFSIRRQ